MQTQSIYQQALGANFDRLHPQIQRRFGLASSSEMAAIGQGQMSMIWNGGLPLRPLLHAGQARHIMFAEWGTQIPFTIENYAYRDAAGRETVTWLRTFQVNPQTKRRFDAYMVYSDQRACIVDYLGTHQHFAVDLAMWVDQRGGMCLRSGAQRFYEGWLGFKFPRILSGTAEVCEWYDEATAQFRISVVVTNPVWGPVFGYQGTFTVEWRPMCATMLPAKAFPQRLERRA
ncbi:DUF4166 domain-containing protein [Herpetosiphon llansteffanensis]